MSPAFNKFLPACPHFLWKLVPGVPWQINDASGALEAGSKMKNTSLVLFQTLLFLSVPAGLSAERANSRISAVTVYRDRAIVTRTASAQLAAGEQVLSFENLPAALVDQSLQASGRGIAGATILDVSAQNVFAEATSNDRVKELETQIKELQRQRRVLDDRGKVLEEQRGFVQRMLQSSTTNGPAGATGAVARPTLDEWQKLFAYSEETLGKINAEQQKLDVDREPLQAKQTALEQQLNQLRGARGKQSKTITIRMSLTTPGKLDVVLQYAVPAASWAPSYDARLRSADRAIDLSYFGIVRNGTGEDWNDVALTLSTARPSLGGGAPELRPWIADVARPSPVPFNADSGRGNARVDAGTQVFNAPAIVTGAPSAAAAKESEARVLSADVEAGATSATFKIPVSVSVPGNNNTQKVAITVGRLMAMLQFQSTPKMLEAAFLNANATNTTEYPLLAGPMNTYLDDTFIAASSVKTVMPGEKFDLALGVDDGIAVKRRLVNRFTEDTGLTSKTRRTTYEILVTITNNKKTTEQVAFKEPTPVSRDEKIVVKLLTPQEKEIGTPANPKEVTREEDGKLVWRVSLKPGEKREFPLKLSIEHPTEMAVTGLE
jgi:uncharacterized protein (TIGR02231 family)